MMPQFGIEQYKLSEVDLTLLWSSIFLLLTGMVMVYSSSIAVAEASRFTGNNPAYYLVRHSIFMAVGFVAAGIVFQVPLRIWQKISPFLFLMGLILLVLVLVPGIGREVKGASRWISLRIVNVQPSEFMKLLVVLYTADFTVRKMEHLHNLKTFLPLAAVMVLVSALLLKQPDFGAFVIIAAMTAGILFLGGIRPRLFAMLISILIVAFTVLIAISPYRRDRIFGFMDPWADSFGSGYQLTQALIAFSRGEWFGVGLGASIGKLFYLPEAHTDFILAVLAEELGFIGVATVIVLFALIVHRAFAIGRQCVILDRIYAALVAQGIGIWIGLQSLINMGVNMGWLPTKGLTLPLMSFGGSGIVANCVALAILLRIDWENRQLMRGAEV